MISWIYWIWFIIQVRVTYGLGLLVTAVLIVLFPVLVITIVGVIQSKLEKRKKERVFTEIVEYLEEYILLDRIIIDSNIWMNKEYDSFFDMFLVILKVYNKKIELLDVQFDEICNIKSKNSYDSQQGASARCAIGRIEKFQCEDLLSNTNLKIDSQKNAYADPILIKCALKYIEDGTKVTIISDDAELRIRTRSFAGDKKDNIVITSGKDLIEICEVFCETTEFIGAVGP
jgi:hypothetical protein